MKQRAAVLIGVRKTGQLHPLQAVQGGVDEITAWVEAQPGFKNSRGEQRVIALTDAQKPVTAVDVRAAVKFFIDLGSIEQLFVYFAGHGVNMRFAEYWLLSGAPDDPNEAVNVKSSVDLARYCGIPHVVFISDACRTAADTIQAQSVEGSIIFPSANVDNEPGCVDVFYATMVGRPALEVRDATATAAAFEAIYTRALVDALSGEAPEVVEYGSAPPGYVRPWPLKKHLLDKVPALLLERGVPTNITQKPDAIITSEPQEWLAEVAGSSPPQGRPAFPPVPPMGDDDRTRTRRGRVLIPIPVAARPRVQVAPLPSMQSESLATIAQSAVRNALLGEPVQVLTRGRRRGPRSDAADLLGEMHARVVSTPPPNHFETQCGFEIHGIAIADIVSVIKVEKLGDRLVRVCDDHGPGNVVVVFADGRGALLPAIPRFIGVLTYDAHAQELLSIEYEPSNNSSRYHALAHLLPAVRTLRHAIAAAAALGSFRLAGKQDALDLVSRLRDLKSVDPSLAVYAAHALHELQRRPDIEEIGKYQYEDIGLRLFDIWMLGNRPSRDAVRVPGDVFPPVPMLSQGWPLLASSNVIFPATLHNGFIQRHVGDSLWTVFDAEGVALVRKAMEKGEIR